MGGLLPVHGRKFPLLGFIRDNPLAASNIFHHQRTENQLRKNKKEVIDIVKLSSTILFKVSRECGDTT